MKCVNRHNHKGHPILNLHSIITHTDRTHTKHWSCTVHLKTGCRRPRAFMQAVHLTENWLSQLRWTVMYIEHKQNSCSTSPCIIYASCLICIQWYIVLTKFTQWLFCGNMSKGVLQLTYTMNICTCIGDMNTWHCTVHYYLHCVTALQLYNYILDIESRLSGPTQFEPQESLSHVWLAHKWSIRQQHTEVQLESLLDMRWPALEYQW